MKGVCKMEDVPLMMDAKDIQALGFSRTLAYQLLNRVDFPSIAIGGRKFVQRDRFFDWMNEQTPAPGQVHTECRSDNDRAGEGGEPGGRKAFLLA